MAGVSIQAAYNAKHYTYFSASCPKCGRNVDGWRSIPNPRKPCYQREGYDCLECGYQYFRQEKQLTPEDAAKHKSILGDIHTTAQCSQCGMKMNCYSSKYEIPSHKTSWIHAVDCICLKCGFWHTESISQLTLEEVNRRRTYEKLQPLPRFQSRMK